MVDVTQACVVAILARAPSAPGKGRLFASLGLAPDPALRAALLLDTLDGVAAPDVARIVAVEPAAAAAEVRGLVPPGVLVIPQVTGDLGERMRALMAELFDAGARAVAVVGSDLPDIHPGLIGQAFAALDAAPLRETAGHHRRLVLGPARDGGYYLVAATHVPSIFGGIEWGSARVLEQTMAAAHAAAVDVCLIDPLGDVDDADDLRAVRAVRTATWTKQWAATWCAGRANRDARR